jgi:oxygen-independent coproporphyrinogen-3 oxidase
MDNDHLIEKYNVPAPRYTSYPTVPYWDSESFNESKWKQTVAQTFTETNAKDGLSLYIHLPFCESLCTYCGCNTRITRNHKVEEPYINAVIKEWQLYLQLFNSKPVLKDLHLGGGTPTFFSAENLKMLLSSIFESLNIHPDAAFSFEAHPANTTTAHLRTLFSAGFRRISFGIQDFDPVVQLIINRIQSYAQVEQATLEARNAGFTSVNYDLIYGLPLQTIAGLTDTIQSVLKLQPDRIAFYSYAHVPWVKPGQRRYTENDLPTAELKQLLYETGRSMLTQGGYEEVGMDHFTLKTDGLFKAARTGGLHRNFMGYTDQYSQLMIGLGVSSISDSWNGFAQNVKKVEDYLDIVNSGRLPVFKGHLLDQDDLIIRKHILNIMCKGKTSWYQLSECSEAFMEGLDRMQVLAGDGLVNIYEKELHLTSLGRRFLRNICMTLDVKLWNNRPATQLFSLAG